MSLSDDLSKLTAAGKCPACTWLKTRTKRERDEIASAIAWAEEGNCHFTDVARLCVTHGMEKMTPQAFRHHVHSHVAV